MKQWFCISVRGIYLGRVFETLEDTLAACGPYHTRTGNHINIFAPLPKGKGHAN